MSTTVLTTTRTKETRREPLRVIDMVTSQAQSRPALSLAPDSGGKGRLRRTSARLNAKEGGGDEGIAVDGIVQGKDTRASGRKRKAGAYDEDVGGFQFTRTNLKKVKPLVSEDAIAPEPLVATPIQQQLPKKGRPARTRSGKKPGVTTEDGVDKTTISKAARGRPRRVSTEQEPDINGHILRRHHNEDSFATENTRKKGRLSKSKTAETNGFLPSEPTNAVGTSKIALPFTDTPVIRRNKEMREGRGRTQRRSSLGMRGRRASSLIESGVSNALPHKEVDTVGFYKHIASEGLSEPRRMKQLLTWCATRAMGSKPSGSRSDDDSARLAARVIQEELLQDFSNKSELSDWFGREDADPPALVVRKPNPKNLQNAEKIKELEEQIQRLQIERQAFNALLGPPRIVRICPGASGDEQLGQQDDRPGGRLLDKGQSDGRLSGIDISLLHPSQQSLLTSLDPVGSDERGNEHKEDTRPSSAILQPVSPAIVSSRLSRITTSLAPALDSFASGIHDIELYRAAADNVSSKILRICSQRLEERDYYNTRASLDIEMGREDGEGGSSKGKSKVRIRPEKQQEDISVVLGALSRIERR
ncbi:Mis12-Mtw1 protein family domain containing protein [Elaphomyces granulatus]